MKRKLWIMYGVLAVTTFIVGIVTDSRPLTYGFAFAAAAAGWAAFLIEDRA